MKYAIVRPEGAVEIRQDGRADLPEGAVLLTDDQHEHLCIGSHMLVAGEIVPATPHPPVPWSPDATLWKLRTAREQALNRLAGIGFAALAGGDTVTVDACLAARLALLAMPALPAVAAATDEASLAVALVAAYMAVVTAAPSNLRSAFAQFNL